MDDVLSFVTDMKRKAWRTYTITGAEIMPAGSWRAWLDVQLRWTGCCLEYKPYVKETSQKRRLCSTSAHPFSCHRSWPLGEIRRLSNRSSNLAVFLVAGKSLDDLRFHMVDERIVSRAEACNPWFCSPPRRTPADPMRWLAIPFHPVISRIGKPSIIDSVLLEWLPVLRSLTTAPASVCLFLV